MGNLISYILYRYQCFCLRDTFDGVIHDDEIAEGFEEELVDDYGEISSNQQETLQAAKRELLAFENSHCENIGRMPFVDY